MMKGPPSNPKKYLETAAGRIEALSARGVEAVRRVRAGGEDAERLLCQFLRYGGAEPEEAARVFSAHRTVEKRIFGDMHGYSLDSVLSDIRSVLRFGVDHVRYLVASAKAMTAPQPHAAALFSVLDAAEAGAAAYGYRPGDPGNMEDGEYVSAMSLLDGLREAASVAAETEALLVDLSDRIGALAEARAHAMFGRAWRPPHEPEETLWHASVHAREISENGFDTVKPAGRRGLGAFGYLPGISFTYEKELAENIASELRCLWDIAHGRTTAADLAALIREEGIDAKCDLRRLVGTDRLEELSSSEDAVKLYRVYLAMSETKDNPVFADMEEMAARMKGVDRDSIGVLECAVELRGDEEYVFAECEFRVAPDRVRSVAISEAPGEGPVAPSSGM